MAITKLEDLFGMVKAKGKKRLVAAYAVDDHTICAVSKAVDLGIVEATLVGDEATIRKVCEQEKIDAGKFKIVQESDDTKAAAKAVQLINDGEGDLLMKGLVSTDKYMRAILNKEKGLMPGPKAMLTHIALLQNPFYHKILVVSDMAIIPAPDLKQKMAICNYLVSTAKRVGIENPKVAVLAATEQVSTGMQACVDGALIAKMAERGQIKGCQVDGPLALDVAIDKEACQIKGVGGPVAGDADCLLFPNIESGNVFYKAHTKFCKGEVAAMVVG
ncbi:MAG: phosphate butyryltransferase, partial [Bacteroidales bacterium]|nr:phosphate butyryltransferase [Bacteroidales bacterium]